MLGAMVYYFHLLSSYRDKNFSKYCSQSLTGEKRGAGRDLEEEFMFSGRYELESRLCFCTSAGRD